MLRVEKDSEGCMGKYLMGCFVENNSEAWHVVKHSEVLLY